MILSAFCRLPLFAAVLGSGSLGTTAIVRSINIALPDLSQPLRKITKHCKTVVYFLGGGGGGLPIYQTEDSLCQMAMQSLMGMDLNFGRNFFGSPQPRSTFSRLFAIQKAINTPPPLSSSTAQGLFFNRNDLFPFEKQLIYPSNISQMHAFL